MKMFSLQFSEQDSFEIEYNGKKVNAFYSFNKPGEYILRFTFVSTSSIYLQAIIIHWSTFEGTMYIEGEEVRKPKGRFPQLIFDEKCSPKQFELRVSLKKGELCICNGSLDTSTTQEMWNSLYGGCAMIIEEMENNCFRFRCNDYENDDDFDDLIFDLEITNVK